MTAAANMTCKVCGSLLSAVTFTCVRGEFCKPAANQTPDKWLLQTYFFWHEMEERGFSRAFDSKEDAERYARNNSCGSRHTITPLYRASWMEDSDGSR